MTRFYRSKRAALGGAYDQHMRKTPCRILPPSGPSTRLFLLRRYSHGDERFPTRSSHNKGVTAVIIVQDQALVERDPPVCLEFAVVHAELRSRLLRVVYEGVSVERELVPAEPTVAYLQQMTLLYWTADKQERFHTRRRVWEALPWMAEGSTQARR